jgi:hypothetical protein
VEGDVLGDEFKGYVFKIMGGQDKQVRCAACRVPCVVCLSCSAPADMPCDGRGLLLACTPARPCLRAG